MIDEKTVLLLLWEHLEDEHEAKEQTFLEVIMRDGRKIIIRVEPAKKTDLKLVKK